MQLMKVQSMRMYCKITATQGRSGSLYQGPIPFLAAASCDCREVQRTNTHFKLYDLLLMISGYADQPL